MRIPSWANNMVRNFRNQAQIPNSITNEELYQAIHTEKIDLFEDAEDQLTVLRAYFNLINKETNNGQALSNYQDQT